MDYKLVELADEVENAKDELRLYKLAIKLGILGIVAGLVSAAVGIAVGVYSSVMNQEHGGMVCAFIIPGLIGAIIAGALLGCYVSDHTGRCDPRRGVREAQRKYDHYITQDI